MKKNAAQPLRIGLLTPKLASQYISSIVEAFDNRSYDTGKYGCDVELFCTRGEEKIKNNLLEEIAADKKVDALAVLFLKPSEKLISKYKKAGIPLVLIENDAPGVHSVNVDNFKGSFKAVDYLCKYKRDRVGLIRGQTAGEEVGSVPLEREYAYKEALKKNSITYRPQLVIDVKHHTMQEGSEALTKLLSVEPKLDAVFCAAGDLVAAGVLKEARMRRIKVPQELAVIGYDDQIFAPLIEPALTTVRQPITKIGETAFEICMEAAQGKLTREKKVVFDPELIKRESA